MKCAQLFIFSMICLLSAACGSPILQPQVSLPTLMPTAVPAFITPTLRPTFTPTHTVTPTFMPTATATETAVPPTQTIDPLNPPTLTPLPTITNTPLSLPTPQNAISTTLKVPVLMYHYISTPPENADIYRTDLSVEPQILLEQMSYLAQNGFHTIDFYDLSRAITHHQPLPPKPIILTFDDGYIDNYQNAFPILEQFGFKATFFIVTEFIDRGREGYMTWEMIQTMATAGHRFEPHSRTHPDLRERERDYLLWEILGPQETLAFHIGYTPRYFSYPSGRYDAAVIAMLNELGFWGALTTQSGKCHGFEQRFEWPRLRVRNNTPLPEFIDLVQSGDPIVNTCLEEVNE